MMNKRVRAWILCVLALCSVLTLFACKDKDESSDKPTTTPTQPSTEATNPSTEATDPSTDVSEPSTDGTEPSTEPSEETNPTVPAENAVYKVTLMDAAGNPCGDKMLVTFMKDGTKVSMIKVNKEGVAQKELPKGDYTVVVSSTNADAVFYYSEESASLSADKTESTIVLYNEQGEEYQTIHAVSPSLGQNLPYEAYQVSAGSTHVYLTAGDRAYFLFAPTQSGTYEFSVNGDMASIGIYGGSVNYIQDHSMFDVVDNKINVSVYSSMIGSGVTGTTVYVIGLDGIEGAEDCILNIIRTGEPAWTIDSEPWNVYKPQIAINPFALAPGSVLKEFDLTAATDAYKLVLDADGYYHLNSATGPRVYIQLEEQMFGISMLEMVGEIIFQDGELIPTGTAPFRYMYNNGKDDFFKEDYTDAMREYVTNRCPATGVYPLTKDLAYILPMGMKNLGWLREDTSNYLFRDLEDFNPELGWLFMCVYEDVQEPPQPTEPTDPKPTDPKPTEPFEPSQPTEPSEPSEPSQPTEPSEPTEPEPQPPIEDNPGEPIMVGGTLQFDAEIQANHIVYYDLLKYNDATLIIRNPNAYVIYNKKTYEAVDGVVTVPGLYVRYTNQPIQIAIGNKGTEDATFSVEFTYPEGHINNPIQVEMGTIVTDVAKGNEVGVNYQWTATADGTLTLTLESITEGVGADILITRVEIIDGMEIPRTVSLAEAGGTTITVDVKAGELVKIVIGTQPVKNKYPAATITTVVSFS